MPQKEKARQKGEPIPNDVCQDSPEFTNSQSTLQVACLTRRHGLTADMAAVFAPMVFPEASR
jgi:hypothetical protein